MPMHVMQVISFNMGSLGFLTNHNFNSMSQDLTEVIYGSESLEQCAIDGSVSQHTVAFALVLQRDVVCSLIVQAALTGRGLIYVTVAHAVQSGSWLSSCGTLSIFLSFFWVGSFQQNCCIVSGANKYCKI